MKQKMVIKVQIHDQRSRSKALKIAVSRPGVTSAAIEGKDKDQILVIGEGVDAVKLTTLLRKSLGFADIVSVSTVEEKKEEKKTEVKKEEKKSGGAAVVPYPYVYYMSPREEGTQVIPYQYVHEIQENNYNDPCSIM